MNFWIPSFSLRFNHKAFRILIPFFVSICFFLNPGNLLGEKPSISEPPTENLNVVLLMDTSASMLINDPLKLRVEGARLLLQFLKSGDSLGVVRFDESAELLKPLSSFSSDQVPNVIELLNSAEASGQFTDLNAGLLKAQAMLKANPNNAKSVIVLLSDGKMDPAPARGTAESHLDSLTTTILPSLKNNNINVYTLSFSADADRVLLQHIAQATDGVNWFTPNSETIHESFAELFLSLKKPQVVAYGARGFKLEAGVEEATFYINQPEEVKLEIEDPNGERFNAREIPDNIRWYDGKKFSVITISHPISGEWQLIGVNPDEGFATILTNLKLVSDWPNAISINEPVLLQARLYDGKLPVDLEAISSAVTFAFQVTPSDRVSEPVIREFLSDEGKNGDENANDGIFSHTIKLPDAGEYRLRILAKGPTFERQLQIPFRVRPPVVNLEITDPLASLLGSEDPEPAHKQPEIQNGESEAIKKDAKSEEGDHPARQAKQGKSQLINGSNAAIFEVSLNDEASTFKNVKVNIVAIDRKRDKFTIAASLPSPEPKALAQETQPGAGHETEPEAGHEAGQVPPGSKAGHGQSGQVVYQALASALPEDGTYEVKAYLEARTRDGNKIEEESDTIKFNRKTVRDVTAVQVEVKPVEKVEPVEAPPAKDTFDILSLIIITLVNAGLAAGLYFMLKKAKSTRSASVEFQLPEISANLLSQIADLEKRSQLESVDFSDERFKEASSSVAEAPEITSGQQATEPREIPAENSDTDGETAVEENA